METTQVRNQKINIEIVGTLFALSKVLVWIKKASMVLGFTYKVRRED